MSDLVESLRTLPYGSDALLDAVDAACDLIDDGRLEADLLDQILFDRFEQQRAYDRELLAEFHRDWLKPYGVVEPAMPPADPTAKFIYTLKEIKTMRLADALRAIRSVDLSEITTELNAAKKNLEEVKREAKAEYQRKIKAALDEVKMLNRLKMSKEKSGKPLGKKGRAA